MTPAAPAPAAERWSRPGLVALTAVALALLAAAWRSIWESDYWWQLAAGRLVATSGPPRTDPFSWAVPGRPWIELRWGYDLLLHHVVSWSGPAGAVALKALLLLAAFGMAVAPLLTRRNGVTAAAVALVAVLASQQRFFVRPELFTYLLLALQLLILERDRRVGDRRIWLLPFLSILWANTHTLAILGPIVTLLAAVSRVRSPRAPLLLGVAALQFAAGFLTPYGVAGFLHPFQLFGEIRGTAFKSAITEFESPWRVTASFPAVLAYRILAVTTLAAALFRPKRLDPFRLLVTAAMFYLSCLAIRNLPLFALAAIPFLIHQLSPGAPDARDGTARRSAVEVAGAVSVVLVALLFTASVVTNRFYAWTGDTNRFGAGIAPHRYPARVVERLEALPPAPGAVAGAPRRLFNTMHEGSYLVARGIPVFIDPRLEVQGEAHFARYLRLLGEPTAWAEAQREFRFEAALVDLEQLPFLGARLADGWRLAAWDETAVLLVAPPGVGPEAPALDLDADVARLRAVLPRVAPGTRDAAPGGTASAPYHRVANLLVRLGRLDLARPFLEDAVAGEPGNNHARFTLGQILETSGDAAGAERAFAEAVRRAPKDIRARGLLGRFFATHGRVAEGRALLEAVCWREGSSDPLAWAILASTYAGERQYDRALEALERAATLDPANDTIRENMARIRAARADR